MHGESSTLPWPREVAGPLRRLFRLKLQQNVGWKIDKARQVTAFGIGKDKSSKAQAVHVATELLLAFCRVRPRSSLAFMPDA